jgi:aspartate/methionine/tyrosine aminotransferase
MLASMRLCANHQAQYAIQTALGGYQSINDLIRPSGRLYEQRNIAWEMLNEIQESVVSNLKVRCIVSQNLIQICITLKMMNN